MMIRLGNFLFKYRDIAFTLVFVTLAVATGPVLWGGTIARDRAADALGLGLSLTGQALRFAVIGFAYIRRGGVNKTIQADVLVQDGLFAHCRNPLYVGNVLVVIGLMVVHGSPWFIVLGASFYVMSYRAIVAAEEQWLRGRFGAEYDDYCRRVPRFWIDFRGLRRTAQGLVFNWSLVARKEYGSTFYWIACALGFLIWERVRYEGYAASAHTVRLLALGYVPLVIAYVVIRVLKKRRLLGRGHAPQRRASAAAN